MADEASPERLGDGIHGFQEAAQNGNALVQELRGTLAAFVNGQYSVVLDTPVGKVRVTMEKNVQAQKYAGPPLSEMVRTAKAAQTESDAPH